MRERGLRHGGGGGWVTGTLGGGTKGHNSKTFNIEM